MLFANVTRMMKGRAGVRIHRAFSNDVLPAFRHGSLDAVYVDGDHSYAGVVRDLMLSACLLRRGGWLMGHDYDVNPAKATADYTANFGVRKALHKLLDSTGLSIHALAFDGYVSFAVRIPE